MGDLRSNPFVAALPNTLYGYFRGVFGGFVFAAVVVFSSVADEFHNGDSVTTACSCSGDGHLDDLTQRIFRFVVRLCEKLILQR